MKPRTHADAVRQSFGSGRWFPGNGHALREMLDDYLMEAILPALPAGDLQAVIAPHAGYIYSGGVAGHSFRALQRAVQAGQSIDTVVVLGFCHRDAFRGVALMDGAALETPLGRTALDRDALETLVASSELLHCDYRPHMGEHSAENQVPFVQRAAPDARLVVALMGNQETETVDALVRALEALADHKRIVLVASTDLLHDADYDRVSATDAETLKRIVSMDIEGLCGAWGIGNQVCCGIGCVLTAIRYARARGAVRGSLLTYRNSGDDFPESRGNWVVGYGAVAFCAGSR